MKAREMLEKTYRGVCTIKGMNMVKIDGETRQKEVIIVENQPCRLSHNSGSSSKQGEINSEVSRTIKLFLSPDIDVKVGSSIIVVQQGRTYDLKSSGLPAIYSTHQEVSLIEEGNT